VSALHDVAPHATPGARFAYSNEGYVIVGRTIEVVAGKSLEACFSEGILDAVGMTRSAVRFDEWRADPDRAYLYAGSGIGPYGSGQHHGDYAVVNLVGDYQTFLSTGGVVSTAHDLALYQSALTGVNSSLGLSQSSLEQMMCTQYLYGQSGWGYGLGLFTMWSGTTKVVGHSGGLPGVSTYSLMIPSEGTGVVVLTNRSDIKAMGLAELLANELRGVLWRDSLKDPLPVSPQVPDLSADGISAYLGTYRFRRGDAQVEPAPDGVIVRTPSRYDGPMVEIPTRYVGGDRFLSLKDGHTIDFLRGDDGKINGFLNSGYRYVRQS
jgi:CubicO group peptidase (beta-lactamase class C family)